MKDMDGDDIDLDFQWTDEARAKVIQQGEVLLEALRSQLHFYASANEATPLEDVWTQAELVERAALEFSGVEFDFTGSPGPFARLAYDDDEDYDEDEYSASPREIKLIEPQSTLAYLRRWDYTVVDETQVLEAGRRSFRRQQPEQAEQNAKLYVANIGAALYQITHEGEFNLSSETPGLQLTATVSEYRLIPESDASSPRQQAGDTDDPFSFRGEILFREEDVII